MQAHVTGFLGGNRFHPRFTIRKPGGERHPEVGPIKRAGAGITCRKPSDAPKSVVNGPSERTQSVSNRELLL